MKPQGGAERDRVIDAFGTKNRSRHVLERSIVSWSLGVRVN
ncbi:hypothetical protein [Photobacterium damselae]